MAGIFYDPRAHRIHAVHGTADPCWTLVTHNLNAGPHHCRRIMREWLAPDEIQRVDWSVLSSLRSG